MSFSDADLVFMQEALNCALKPLRAPHPNPRVGCVLVQADRIIGRGWHEKAGSLHAESMALETAKAAGEDLKGATAYVTLEPCAHQGRTPPCTMSLIKAGISTVIAAMQDPNPLVSGKGFEALRAAGIEVKQGLLAEEAKYLNAGFVSRHVRKRPWVRAKVGMSLDGRIALANGESKWITCETARADVQTWRGNSDVILTGMGTLLKDDSQLTVRERDGSDCMDQPLRVVVSRTRAIPDKARILEVGKTILARNVALDSVLAELGEGYNEVWVEAGPTLLSALWRENLIDEWILYIAPKFLGSKALGFLDTELQALSEAIVLKWQSVEQVGNSLRLVLRVSELP